MSDSNGTNQPGSSPFRDERLDVDARAADLLKQMTIDEKLAICNGKTLFLMKPIKRLGIPSVGITDGPCGVGSHSNWLKRNTLFGCGILFGSTWNLDLLAEFGTAVAQEVRACGKHVLLGPGVNIQRSPLCGRTWEYLSEDPFLAKKLAPAIIKGIQSQRIGACVKHFACNSSETRRNRVSAEVSERALQEIYLPAFKASVMDGDTWSLMSSYNRINGIYASENKDLLISKLRDQWGSKGFVMSDWYATLPTTSTEACVNAGLSLDMPGRSSKAKLHIKRMREAFKAGKFTEEMLNENVRRMLRVMILVGLLDDPASIPKGSRNTPEHRAISRKVAADGMVLLKNEKNVLPLDASKIKTIAVLGPNANMKSMAIPMSGVSAWVSPPHEITPLRGLKKACKGKIKIVKDPAKADVAIVVAGLNHRIGQDSESGDRKRLELPSKQIALINATVAQNPNTIVVLVNGSPVAMDGWIEKVPAVLESWYGGMEAGHVIADILFGNINPSGKLPITFPKKLSDSPAHVSKLTFPGIDDKEQYDEGIFVGYRHFDKKGIEPLFPFGHGLSYTTFEYRGLKVSQAKVSGDAKFSVAVDVKNTGNRPGAEIVQLYIQDMEASVDRPIKELKGFRKVVLEPGKQETVTIDLCKEDLSFYSEKEGAWIAEPGKFTILAGSSSRDIRLNGEIEYV